MPDWGLIQTLVVAEILLLVSVCMPIILDDRGRSPTGGPR
jgi:hypothetical protein